MSDPYILLGVPRDASEAVIRQAYKRKAMKMHPDRGGSVTGFQELSQAYNTLLDPVKRAALDQGSSMAAPSAVMTPEYIAELMKRNDNAGVCSVCRGEKVIREAGSIFWTRKPCPKCQPKTAEKVNKKGETR